MERADSDLGFKSLLQIRAKTWTRGSGYGSTMAPWNFCSGRHVATCLDGPVKCRCPPSMYRRVNVLKNGQFAMFRVAKVSWVHIEVEESVK